MVNSGMRRVLEALGSGVVVYVVVVACSSGGDEKASGGSGGSIADALTDPVANADAEESGTRLKARRLKSSDGASQFLGWRDAQRDENCAFAKADDGILRCIPEHVSDPNVGKYFVDAQCTEPVMSVPESCPPKYLGQPIPDAQCGGGALTKIYAIGGAAPNDVYELIGTDCLASNLGGIVRKLTVVAATEFVQADEDVDP